MLEWLPFFGQFLTIKNQNHVQQSKKQLPLRIQDIISPAGC
jgi:hypothetical protein